VPVAHAYNPSYSGSRDQEDQGVWSQPRQKKKKEIFLHQAFSKMAWSCHDKTQIPRPAPRSHLFYLFIYLFWQYWGLNSGPHTWATPPTPFCVWYSWDKFSRTLCPGWLRTNILLISASWVARITGMCLGHPAQALIWRKLESLGTFLSSYWWASVLPFIWLFFSLSLCCTYIFC
jgi:hypothetical protein